MISPGTKIWWSTPDFGTMGRKIRHGTVQSIDEYGRYVVIVAKHIYIVGKKFAQTGKPPKTHEGYGFV